jgi:hypothetical protein
MHRDVTPEKSPRGAMPRNARRVRWRGWIVALVACAAVHAAPVVVPGPDPESRRFGSQLIVLPGGNYLVTDPAWSPDPDAAPRGAVYLYAADGTLIDRLTGGVDGDRLGAGGIVVLADGNFVVQSPHWRPSGRDTDVGAVTWGDADTGFPGTPYASADNSLVGSTDHDRVGANPVVALPDGSYVVASGEWDRVGVAIDAGAVTWCAAGGATVGEISAANSLVGTSFDDRVGDITVLNRPAVVALGSGHYVVASDRWDRGAIANAGAVTWARGDGTTVGEVGVANSLVGVTEGDYVGAIVQALANDHYIVQSPYFDHGGVGNVGAVTWADGSATTSAEVGPANSLIGSSEYDVVGLLAAVLTNGHYVVASPVWDHGAIENVGAVTWRDGTGPSPAIVSPANSLVGSSIDDSVGWFVTIGISALGVIPLANGNYVVASPSWDDGAVRDVGAATWGSGSGGLVGPVSAANSLVGGARDDAIAQYIVPLPDGDYVLGSPFWSESRGAATWGDGSGASTGVVDATNSLVGSTIDDLVTASGIYPLVGGDYVVGASRWSREGAPLAGAVARGRGDGSSVGPIGPSNAVVGVQGNDRVGLGGVFALPDGGFLVRSGLASGFGAITRSGFPDGPGPSHVEAANSLSGRTETDRIGGPGAVVQSDGAIIVYTANIAQDNAGAVSLFGPADPFRGFLPEEDTVRSATPDGGPLLQRAYLPASGTLLVGDPASNRVVRLTRSRLLRDGFE